MTLNIVAPNLRTTNYQRVISISSLEGQKINLTPAIAPPISLIKMPCAQLKIVQQDLAELKLDVSFSSKMKKED